MYTKSVGESLAEFQSAFNCPQNVPFLLYDRNYWTSQNPKLLVLRKNLIEEETNELIEAIAIGDKADILKELVDVVVVCVGMADTYGWDFDTAFKRVHESNMSKLDMNGKPIYREDGKVLKSKNYVPPDLSDLV
jgi:predicted HAD superfamily Cof-like phosphohydrolase